MTKILLAGGIAHSLVNFRGELIKQLAKQECTVHTVSNLATEQERKNIHALGANHSDIHLHRNGLNPIADIKTIWQFKKLLQSLQPDLVLAYTIKPVIWGGIATRFFSNARFIALITGLGFAFQGQGKFRKILKFLVSTLYKTALNQAESVIFQNPDDLKTFVELGIVSEEKCHIVPGSGVDTSHFTASPSSNQDPVFLTVARLLEEKGIRVYYEAATIVKKSYPSARFKILGPTDPSPDAIKIQEVLEWEEQGSIEYLGEANDVRPAVAGCDIFVLASFYGEGLPRTIIEAMAMGKPIITTDNVGCREPIEVGKNGFLVPIKDANALAEKMIWFIENTDQWKAMGDQSRNLAVTKFDTKIINKQMLQIMGIGTA